MSFGRGRTFVDQRSGMALIRWGFGTELQSKPTEPGSDFRILWKTPTLDRFAAGTARDVDHGCVLGLPLFDGS